MILRRDQRPEDAADGYAGADLRRAQLFSLGSYAFGAVVRAVLLLAYPPNARGPVGYGVAAVSTVVLTGFLAACAAGRASFATLLAQQYACAGLIALLQLAPPPVGTQLT